MTFVILRMDCFLRLETALYYLCLCLGFYVCVCLLCVCVYVCVFSCLGLGLSLLLSYIILSLYLSLCLPSSLSCLVLSYLGKSCFVLCCLGIFACLDYHAYCVLSVLSCLVLSCLVLSCLVLSCLVGRNHHHVMDPTFLTMVRRHAAGLVLCCLVLCWF